MSKIDLSKDAKKFRQDLDRVIAMLAAKKKASISAIEIGFDCNEGGWIVIHPDPRPTHERDGEWTTKFDEKQLVKFPKWCKAREASFEGEEIEVTQLNGEVLLIPGFDEDDEEGEDDENDPLATAIGEMIYEVVMAAKSEGAFKSLAGSGSIQIDIEDFNGSWAWPEYDELGKSNLV